MSPCPQPSKGLWPTPLAAWCKASGGGDAGHLGSGLRRATGAQGHPQGSRGVQGSHWHSMCHIRHSFICTVPATIKPRVGRTGPQEPTWAGGEAGSEDRLLTRAWTASLGRPLGNGGSLDRAVAPEVTTRELALHTAESRLGPQPSLLPSTQGPHGERPQTLQASWPVLTTGPPQSGSVCVLLYSLGSTPSPELTHDPAWEHVGRVCRLT